MSRFFSPSVTPFPKKGRSDPQSPPGETGLCPYGKPPPFFECGRDFFSLLPATGLSILLWEARTEGSSLPQSAHLGRIGPHPVRADQQGASPPPSGGMAPCGCPSRLKNARLGSSPSRASVFSTSVSVPGAGRAPPLQGLPLFRRRQFGYQGPVHPAIGHGLHLDVEAVGVHLHLTGPVLRDHRKLVEDQAAEGL